MKDVFSILSHNETPVILPSTSMIMESDVDMHSKKHGLLGARRQRRREHDWVTAEHNLMIEYVDKCVQEPNLYKDEGNFVEDSKVTQKVVLSFYEPCGSILWTH